MSNDDYTHRWTWEERLLHPVSNKEEEILIAKIMDRMKDLSYSDFNEMFCKKFKRNTK